MPVPSEGDLVEVMPRKWPGINKDGGTAKITSIHPPRSKGKKRTNKRRSKRLQSKLGWARRVPRGRRGGVGVWRVHIQQHRRHATNDEICGTVRPDPDPETLLRSVRRRSTLRTGLRPKQLVGKLRRLASGCLM